MKRKPPRGLKIEMNGVRLFRHKKSISLFWFIDVNNLRHYNCAVQCNQGYGYLDESVRKDTSNHPNLISFSKPNYHLLLTLCFTAWTISFSFSHRSAKMCIEQSSLNIGNVWRTLQNRAPPHSLCQSGNCLPYHIFYPNRPKYLYEDILMTFGRNGFE